MALPFAHLCGRPLWEHCDHEGTCIDGDPAGVRLAPKPEANDPTRGGGKAETHRQAWERQRGAAAVLTCGPAACEERQVLLLDRAAGVLVLKGEGWEPPGDAAPATTGQTGHPRPPGPSRAFQPPQPPRPPHPAGLAVDPRGGLWLLDGAQRALRRLGSDGAVAASVALPPGWEPLRFGCSALGLLLAVRDQRGPAWLFRPWQGDWRGLRLPASTGAGSGWQWIDQAADPTMPWAAALIRLESAEQPPSHRLVLWDGVRWRDWPAPTLRHPHHLVIDGAESVLVSEPDWGPGDSRPALFTRLLIRPAGVEAGESRGVRGFDGRGLWREGEVVMASTPSGGRPLRRRERPLRSAGRVETRALDSGRFACHWHRLFVDVCLPPGTGLWVEARSSDDLPPPEVRRGARRPQALAGDQPPEPPPPPSDDPWTPLASRSADDQEGWQRLALPDRRPPLIDRPLDHPAAAPQGMETLEWLVSTPPGRYLWLRLHLEGDGRRGPVIHALRVTHPRPPWLERLPAFWRTDPEAGERSERLRALFEGPVTELEERSEALLRLFLPALAPAEALPWLADFLALSFHDQLPERVRRRLLAAIATLYRQRGTRPGLRQLLSILAEAPVTIVEGFQLRRRTAALVGEASVVGPALELGGRQGSLGAMPVSGLEPELWLAGDDEQRMALAQGVLLAHREEDRNAGQSPCPSQDPPSPVASDPLRAWFRQRAHRFTVLIPRCRTAALEAVLEQALELHKPAHTQHRLCWLEAGFCLERGVLVGLHRLGRPARAAPPVLGQALLGGGTDPLGGGPSRPFCGPGVAVMPFLPMRSRQP
ncbi:MAG: phage tail protein [Cyanobacteriota bacterium]